MLSVSILGMKDQKERFGEIDKQNIDYIHLDIMDGLFVNNSFFVGEDVVEQFRKPLDVHLMVKDPANYIAYYAKYHPKFITIHVEIANPIVYLDSIRNKKIGAGLAISPKTKVEVLEPYLPYVDMILVMSVEPGAGGQTFDSSALGRIKKIKEMCQKVNPSIVIAVDGGINGKNIKSCKDAGASHFVVGTYITSSNVYEEVVKELKEKIG